MAEYSVTVRKVEVYHFDELNAEDVDHAESLAKEIVHSHLRHAFKVNTTKETNRDCSHTQVTVRSPGGVCFLIAREDEDGEVERDDFTDFSSQYKKFTDIPSRQLPEASE